MSEADATDLDLGEFDQPPEPLTPEQLVEEARVVAKSPKIKIDEMIKVAFDHSCNIEASQRFLLLTKDRTTPSPQQMREAAVLGAIGEFLSLCKMKEKAVAAALRGHS